MPIMVGFIRHLGRGVERPRPAAFPHHLFGCRPHQRRAKNCRLWRRRAGNHYRSATRLAFGAVVLGIPQEEAFMPSWLPTVDLSDTIDIPILDTSGGNAGN